MIVYFLSELHLGWTYIAKCF